MAILEPTAKANTLKLMQGICKEDMPPKDTLLEQMRIIANENKSNAQE